jgi:hypothetical protein
MRKLSTVPPTTQDIVGSNSLADLADPVLLAEHEAATAALNSGLQRAPAHFQQAKTDGPTSHFLQIVAKPKRAARKKPEPKLTRVACQSFQGTSKNCSRCGSSAALA